MPGTMNEADLVADHKAALQDAKNVFTAAGDEDFKRHLRTAALDLGRRRTRTLVGTLALVADQAGYAPLPADFVAFKSHLWGIAPRPAPAPWEKGYPGRLPTCRVAEEGGVRKLFLDPAPTAAQISVLGAEFRYYYAAGHAIAADAEQTTVLAGDRQVLLLRAQAEAMREMAMRNIMKPVQLRDGVSSMPKNGLPSYLYEKLMEEFERA